MSNTFDSASRQVKTQSRIPSEAAHEIKLTKACFKQKVDSQMASLAQVEQACLTFELSDFFLSSGFFFLLFNLLLCDEG